MYSISITYSLSIQIKSKHLSKEHNKFYRSVKSNAKWLSLDFHWTIRILLAIVEFTEKNVHLQQCCGDACNQRPL